MQALHACHAEDRMMNRCGHDMLFASTVKHLAAALSQCYCFLVMQHWSPSSQSIASQLVLIGPHAHVSMM